MRRRWWPVLLPLVGCSSLTGDQGVVALEVRVPSPAVVEHLDTLALRARAIDINGDSIAATIFWRTPDSTLVLDTTGFVTTDSTSGTGRVQARVGRLVSDLVTLTIRPRSDTLQFTGPDSLTVAAGDSASAGLQAAVLSFDPAGPISGTSILFQVVDSAAAQGTVHFAGGGLALRATTGSTGEPVTAVTLRRTPGVAQPASVEIEISASRPSGHAVPGSGQRFTILFQ